VAQQSGGSVWVYSEVGKGTTFKVYLPRVDEAVDTLRDAEIPATLRGSETILLVEDEDQVRAVARGILRRSGYHVIEARNAGEALLHSEGHPGTIDLLLSDVVMPGGVNGRQLADQAKRQRPGLKILFMTGYTRNAIVHHGRLDAGVHMIGKPFSFEELAAKVRERLDAAE